MHILEHLPGWLHVFNVKGFMPHAYCIADPGIILEHIIGDTLVALAYFLIPLLIFRYVLDARFVPNTLLAWFAAFILLCGATHVMSIVVLYYPLYVLEGWLKLATGVVSLITLVKLAITFPVPWKGAIQFENFLLVREISRVSAIPRTRDIDKAIRLRTLIKKLNDFADQIDLEIT